MEAIMSRFSTKSVARFLLATLAISLSYFVLTWATPAMSWSVGSGITWRISNSLRALVLATPAGAFGVAFGGQWANITSGRFFVGLFSLLSMGQLLFGLLAYWLSSRFGKSHMRRLAILALYGTLMGILVAVNKAFFVGAPIMMSPVAFKTLLFAKILTEGTSTMAGYPLYLIFKR